MQIPLQITIVIWMHSAELEAHIRDKAQNSMSFSATSCPAVWWSRCRTSTIIRVNSSMCASTLACQASEIVVNHDHHEDVYVACAMPLMPQTPA